MADAVLQQRIKEVAAHHGSIRAAARVLMVDHAYLYRLSIGEKDDPGDDLLRRLKLRRVVSYERTDGVQTCPRCGRAAANLFRVLMPGDELDTVHCGCIYVPRHLTPEVIAGVPASRGETISGKVMPE